MAAAAAALTWALAARFSPVWALFGGMLPAVRFGIFKWDANLSWAYWLESYWGGELGLLGGALVFGAAFRLLRTPGSVPALVLGLGTAVLAANRPYEGLLVVSSVVAVLLLRMPAPSGLLGRVRALVPALAAPAVALVCLSAYSNVVVGKPLSMPHTVYTDQYQHVGHFVWSNYLEPEFAPDSRIGRFHAGFGPARLRRVQEEHEGIRPINISLQIGFYLGAALLLVWPALMFDLRNDAVRLSLIALAASSAGQSVVTVSTLHAHYFGPVSPALVILSVAALRRLSQWTFQSRPVGAALSAACLTACVLTFVVSVSLRAGLYSPSSFPVRRQAINDQLEATPEPDLVIVTYGPNYLGGREWVYSPAVLETAAVVWAHDLGKSRNQRLIDEFPGRQVWSLTLSGSTEDLRPYSPQETSDHPK